MDPSVRKPLEYVLIDNEWRWGGPLLDSPEFADTAAKLLQDIVRDLAQRRKLPGDAVAFRIYPDSLEIVSPGAERTRKAGKAYGDMVTVFVAPLDTAEKFTLKPSALTNRLAPAPVVEPGPPAEPEPRTRTRKQTDTGNDVETFRSALETLTVVKSSDPSRVALNYIEIDITKGLAVATDGHRLCYVRLPTKFFNRISVKRPTASKNLHGKLLLSGEATTLLIKKLKGQTHFNMVVYMGEGDSEKKTVQMIVNGLNEGVYEYDAEFPRWENVLPQIKDARLTLTFDRDKALAALDELAAFPRSIAKSTTAIFNERLKAQFPDRYVDAYQEKNFRVSSEMNYRLTIDRADADGISLWSAFHIDRPKWQPFFEELLSGEERRLVWRGVIPVKKISGKFGSWEPYVDRRTATPYSDVGLNWLYLRHAVQSMPPGDVRVRIIDAINPIAVEPSYDPAAIGYVIMPMRM